METLLLRPDAGSYSQEEGAEVIAVALDGGSARYRRDKIGASRTVSAAWTMNPEEYAYWRAFWHTSTQRGALPFVCDLVGEDGQGPQPHTCRFVPGTVSLGSQMGRTYVMQATLEVTPQNMSDVLNLSAIALFTGGMTEQAINQLAHLVNVTLPESFN